MTGRVIKKKQEFSSSLSTFSYKGVICITPRKSIFHNKMTASYSGLFAQSHSSLVKSEFLLRPIKLCFASLSRTYSCDRNTFLLQHPKLLRRNAGVTPETLSKMTRIGKAAFNRNVIDRQFSLLEQLL
jgi:hypothetical protein